jgi:hypothetical protein
MADSDYWDVVGQNWMDDLDDIARIKMWAALFKEEVVLKQEDAEELPKSTVFSSGDSEIDTQAMDNFLGYLLEASVHEQEMGIAIDTFLSVLSDTFYTNHAMPVPALGIEPKDRPSYNSILKQYLSVVWYLGTLWSKRQSLEG